MPKHPNRPERGLGLLRDETNRSILRTLAERGAASESELAAALILKDRKKLGRHLLTLLSADAIERQRVRRVGRRVDYSLTESGTGLVQVIAGVERWLGRHPNRKLEKASPAGWRAFALLVDAWVVGIAKELAQGPRTLVELAAATEISPARLSGDLVALQGAGMVVTTTAGQAATVYALSEWAVLGIGGVLALSSHWQRTLGERPVPVSVDDALIALGSALPLARLPSSASGTCTLTVELEEGGEGERRSGALRAEIRGGAVSAASVGAGQSAPDAWVHGTISDWLFAAVAGRPSALHSGGRRDLAAALLGALHAAIYDG